MVVLLFGSRCLVIAVPKIKRRGRMKIMQMNVARGGKLVCQIAPQFSLENFTNSDSRNFLFVKTRQLGGLVL